MANAARDQNFVPTLTGVDSITFTTPTTVAVNPTTHRMLVDISGLSAIMQKDVFTASDQQTTFGASATVSFDFYFSINGAIQTPTTDYTVSGTTATLTSDSYPFGVPANSKVIWLYSKS